MNGNGRSWHHAQCGRAVCADRLGHAKKRHQSQPSTISATPATQSGGRCRQVPRLTRKVEVDVASATPAAQSEGLCRQVPRLQRKVHVHLQDSPSVSKCHACQAECRSMSPSARKQPRRQRLQLGTKRAARASPVP